jgi:hypothetical protein
MEANSSGARVFTRPTPGAKLKLEREIPHPVGRLQSHDLGSERPGRVFTPGRSLKHSLGSFEDPAEHQRLIFARELAEVLRLGRTTHQYAIAVLVADPHILGEIEKALDDGTRQKVRCVSMNLGRFTADEIASHIHEALRSIDSDPRLGEAS